jgi:hypothetical protein
MRRILATSLAVTALAAAAQPAAADTTAQFSARTTDQESEQMCVTVWQSGVLGAYGAWGRLIDGCTATVTCPFFEGCRVGYVEGHLRHSALASGQKSTCNSRLRIHTAPSRRLDGSYVPSVVRYVADRSGTGDFTCYALNPGDPPLLKYMERATLQTNGVRNDNPYSIARVESYVELLRR